jgi:xanthine dehydrogenase YagR molybdenum-binding subunit
MPDYSWPEAEKRKLIGKRISRIDGPDKVSGRAKYTYDVKRPGMLYGKILRCPYARAKIVSIDISAAEKMPGVKAVRVMQEPGTEIRWAGDQIVGVAAVDEPTAEDAIRAIKVVYEKLPHLVIDDDLGRAGSAAQAAGQEVTGDPDKAFAETDTVIEGLYGLPVITHCCLEPHGAMSEWEGENNLLVHISTQSVSPVGGEFGRVLSVPASNVHVKMDHVGGGFGSKFQADRWGLETARLSKMAGGKPVKIMLERDTELMVAGARPSAYVKVKVGAKKDGEIIAWDSESWGSGGPAQGGIPVGVIPYIFAVPNRRRKNTTIPNNIGPQRAWRAPNHPASCFVTMSALEDLAAALKMDPLDFVIKNLALTGQRAETYREELNIAAELSGWKKNWHPRGDGGKGPVKRGLGLALQTWGGRGHNSECDVVISPDGSVEIKMGTQDLGTGTRTALAIVVGETLGLPIEAIKVSIGDNRYPASGASGGSTTIGGISAAARRGSVDALQELFAKVAPGLNATPEELEAGGGVIRVKANPARSLPWKEACAKLGVASITARGRQSGQGDLIGSGVGGVTVADVSVDTETGVTRVNKMVSVQDCGLIIDLKTAESQVYGALIMGICYSLYEEKIMDQATGRMLNPNMEFYKLAGIGDIGELVVHMMTGKGHDERGPIGLGEPPVIGPGAAISNAVANAIGVRVPFLPLTPERVLDALEKGGK